MCWLMIDDYIIYYAAFCTVHPDGMPDVPVVHDDIDAFLTNVPDDATFVTQLFVQLVADIFVARHLI